MADETPNVEGRDDAGKPAAEKTPRRGGRGAAAEQPVEGAGAPAEKPRRLRRPAARKADAATGAATGAEETPKSRLPRGRAKGAASEAASSGESATQAAASRPRRIRARSAKAAEGAAAAEAGEPTAAKPARAGGAGAGAAGAKKPAAGASAARRLVPGRGRASSRRPAPIAGQVVYAHARYVRSSARKARIVCDHIRGKSVPEARAILAFAPRGVAKDWSKLLESAVANAEHNHELIGDELHVKQVTADVGPTLKRFRPRAMGRATPINKRTSHLSITLAPKE
jgi:ribosomal protein L22